MSLTVHLPPNTQSLQRSLQLPRYDNRTRRDENAISVECSRLIQSDDRFQIFEGSLAMSANPTSSARVVCKLSFTKKGMDNLAQEDSIYDALKNLQGKVIPRCYGYFENLEIAGCLVLEYAGEPLRRSFEYLSGDLK